MKKTLLFTATVILGTPHAHAWDWTQAMTNTNAPTAYGGAGGAGGNATSASSSHAKSQSQSQSHAGASASNGGVNISESQHGPLGNTPEVNAPSIVTGNECAVGWSASVGGPYAGVGFGKTSPDEGCERRQKIALSWTIGDRNTAVALMCDDPEWAKAIHAHGGTCPSDAQAAPVLTFAPAPALAAAHQTPTPIEANTDLCAARPGWTASEARSYAINHYHLSCP